MNSQGGEKKKTFVTKISLEQILHFRISHGKNVNAAFHPLVRISQILPICGLFLLSSPRNTKNKECGG
jgi:hypothetical protein